MSEPARHLVWTVRATDVEVVKTRTIGRGGSRREITDVVTKSIPGRTFFIQQSALEYARGNGIPYGRIDMHTIKGVPKGTA